MSLSSGLYTIRSAAFNGPFVSRNIFEDLSLGPKKILSLPDTTTDPLFRQWEIEKLENNRYFLRNKGAPTAVINDLVYAILLPEPPAEEWDLQQLPQFGPNQYLILANNGSTGWVLPSSDDFTQVQSIPLFELPIEPESQRWIIESLD